MISRVDSAVIYGMDVVKTEVEAGFIRGIPGMTIVGLPDNAVKESRERIRFAIRNSGFEFPKAKKIVVNLSPADIKKEGASLDLPIGVSILSNHYHLDTARFKDYFICGELNLEGFINPIKGVLNIAVQAKLLGYKGMVVPEANREEATSVKGLDIYCFSNLKDVMAFIKNPENFRPEDHIAVKSNGYKGFDFGDIKGQYLGKRAMEIAAAGFHNLLMVGPPGSGKSMMAKALPSIMPPMNEEDIIETSMIYSAAGLLNRKNGLITQPPFRNPHHTISPTGMSGGGKIPSPGEISLAHNGVLFLDELPYFNKNSLEVLRQPMEDDRITVSRSLISATYPASFMLIAAMNLFEDTGGVNFTRRGRENYYNKISKPLLDRIDIKVEVKAVDIKSIRSNIKEESSEEIRSRVVMANKIQNKRFRLSSTNSNSRMTNPEVKSCCNLSRTAEELLEKAALKMGLSARSYFRTLKTSRTIADLESSRLIEGHHLKEALQYRIPDIFLDNRD